VDRIACGSAPGQTVRAPGLPLHVCGAGNAHARGKGTYEGRIIGAFGDQAAAEITTGDVSRFLRALDRADVSPRNVNKHRQVLSAIFTYAMREDTFALVANPAAATDKRKEMPAAALDFYEPEEVEALAQAAADGRHRKSAMSKRGKPVTFSPEEIAARCAEDAQDAEMFRVLAFTGMRIGEASRSSGETWTLRAAA
jgi:site-specific recombinase XerD